MQGVDNSEFDLWECWGCEKRLSMSGMMKWVVIILSTIANCGQFILKYFHLGLDTERDP